jgi:hypothetical protein
MVMKLFEGTCTALELKGFKPQELANVINGERVFMLAIWLAWLTVSCGF